MVRKFVLSMARLLLSHARKHQIVVIEEGEKQEEEDKLRHTLRVAKTLTFLVSRSKLQEAMR